MNKAGRTLKRVFLVLYLLGVHALAGFYVYERFVAPRIWTNDAFTADVKSPTGETPVPTIIPAIENETANSPENTANSAVNTNQNFNSNYNQSTAPISPADPGALIIPVAGVNPAQLADTFSDARSDNRVHDAIDIMAPAGTPVLAVGDGEIAKFFDSERGGITIYQYSADKKYVYYYAHLQKRADDVAENQYVARGRIIGYVGDTGNAGPGNYHLHFSIALLRDPKRYWEGEYINPFPLLKNGGAAR